MSWSSNAWQQAAPVYQQITEMPFIQQLINGTLPVEKFTFYIQQDSHYLEHFGRALSLIAARANEIRHVLDYIRFAEGAIVVENALHAGYFAQFGIGARAPMAPACHHYTSFLCSTAALAQAEVAMAAVLPCFWIYKQVGDYIYSHKQLSANPYQKWINTYAGEDFGKLVEKAVSICDEVADSCTPQQQQLMTAAFITAARLEWMFWDSAWRLEQWAGTLQEV